MVEENGIKLSLALRLSYRLGSATVEPPLLSLFWEYVLMRWRHVVSCALHLLPICHLPLYFVLTELWLCSGREYAESVGRKVRDLGMVVDLIFLNTEMSLTQALDDVSRGGSPFAIVITQQHQVHRSCTVNIMFGTPQGTEVSVPCHSLVALSCSECCIRTLAVKQGHTGQSSSYCDISSY